MRIQFGSTQRNLTAEGDIMKAIAGAALYAAAAWAASPALAQEPVEITFFMFAGSGSDVVPKEVIADYTAANPHVKINIAETTNTII